MYRHPTAIELAPGFEPPPISILLLIVIFILIVDGEIAIKIKSKIKIKTTVAALIQCHPCLSGWMPGASRDKRREISRSSRRNIFAAALPKSAPEIFSWRRNLFFLRNDGAKSYFAQKGKFKNRPKTLTPATTFPILGVL
jgi:hypothetical protein